MGLGKCYQAGRRPFMSAPQPELPSSQLSRVSAFRLQRRRPCEGCARVTLDRPRSTSSCPRTDRPPELRKGLNDHLHPSGTNVCRLIQHERPIRLDRPFNHGLLSIHVHFSNASRTLCSGFPPLDRSGGRECSADGAWPGGGRDRTACVARGGFGRKGGRAMTCANGTAATEKNLSRLSRAGLKGDVRKSA